MNFHFMCLNLNTVKDSQQTPLIRIGISMCEKFNQMEPRQKETNKLKTTTIPLSCAILMGGKNSRMGGQNKAFLEVGGQTILERILSVTKPLFNETIFVANDSAEQYCKFCPQGFVSDIIPGRGPMSGIHAALKASRNHWCFLFACDLPQLNAEFILKQCQQINSGYEAVVPRHDSGIEPLHALYSKNLTEPLENYLDCCKDNKILLFLETVNTLFWEVNYQNSFININSPNDLDRHKYGK